MVGDAAGHDAGGASGQDQPLHARRGILHPGAVVLARGADVDAGAAAAQGGRRDPGVFDGLPGDLQQQTLLGVHGQGLTRRDLEEAGVEQPCVVQEPAFPCVAVA